MIEIEGQYGESKIMIDNVEDGVISQLHDMMRNPAYTNPIRVMPDTHVGNDVVIGFTCKTNGKICPNAIGVDIGCGMVAQKHNLMYSDVDDAAFPVIDAAIRNRIPLGFNIHTGKNILPVTIAKEAQKELNIFTKKFNDITGEDFGVVDYSEDWYLDNLCKKINSDRAQITNAIGTLGGGNHFIEIDVDEDDYIWSVVHSGSRNFGLKIANYHQKQCGVNGYLEHEWAYDYFVDMFFAQQYASVNRRIISDIIGFILDQRILNTVESTHNYVDPNDMIIRKGAIRSYENELMVIPFNMKDGTIICEGKSNPDWNFSAPHGAGRIMSRTQAKKNLNLDEFITSMNGIFSTSVGKSTLDEAPGAYKPAQIILDAIAPTAKIVHSLKPVYSLKA